MKDYSHAVFIGRFQPFHNGHREIIEKALTIADKVIVLVGSINASPNTKNPFSYEDRERMIRGAFTGHDKRIQICGIRDHFYNENAWLAEVQAKTAHIAHGSSVALMGCYKDDSSYYLQKFPHWDFVPVRSESTIDATTIREELFKQQPTKVWNDVGAECVNVSLQSVVKELPGSTADFLYKYIQTTEFADLHDEYKFIKEYKKSWEGSPFPPTFVTVDAVVFCAGHVLVIRRKHTPGRGLMAIPGGFVKPNETLKDAAIRELSEETGIITSKMVLNENIKTAKVFDHPSRSSRGRTFTSAFLIELNQAATLPTVKGGDDAASAEWISFAEAAASERNFFEDHGHIINYFIQNRGTHV